MRLGDFHDYVEDVLNVGDVADSFIPTAVRQAALTLERNRSLKYMEIYEPGESLASGAASATLGSRTKALHFLRVTLDDGSYQYVEQADPRNFETPEEACPTHFYWSGAVTLRFNNTADQDYSVDLHRIEYTTWPTLLTEEPWLLIFGEDLMLYQTLMQLSVPLKDTELYQSSIPHRDEALRTVLIADQEARSSAEDPEMLFG